MQKLKFKSKNGYHIITCNGRDHIFTSLHDALEYIFYQKFIALVDGRPLGVHNDTLYPVNSLLPPVVEKVAKFYDSGAEIR